MVGGTGRAMYKCFIVLSSQYLFQDKLCNKKIKKIKKISSAHLGGDSGDNRAQTPLQPGRSQDEHKEPLSSTARLPGTASLFPHSKHCQEKKMALVLGQVDLHRKFRFSLTLIQPHRLTGRKTPIYVLTYSTSPTANMENTNVFYRDTCTCKHCSTLSLPKILHCWCNFLSRFVSQVRSENITIQADQMMLLRPSYDIHAGNIQTMKQNTLTS